MVSIPILVISTDILASPKRVQKTHCHFPELNRADFQSKVFTLYERIVLVYDIQGHRLMEQGYNFNTYEDFHLYFFEHEHNELNLYIFWRLFILTYSKILISWKVYKALTTRLSTKLENSYDNNALRSHFVSMVFRWTVRRFNIPHLLLFKSIDFARCTGYFLVAFEYKYNL